MNYLEFPFFGRIITLEIDNSYRSGRAINRVLTAVFTRFGHDEMGA